MRFAKLVFLIAGIYGLIVLVPQYFFEARTGHDYPPPITHPEYYYGFIGLAVVWQLAFLLISRDPVRYHPLMIAAILEKACFAIPAVILLLQNRIPGLIFAFAMIDAVLGVLFLIAYVKTKELKPVAI